MYYFLVNTTGGSGKTANLWTQIKAELIARKVKFKAYQTFSGEHVRRISGKISKLPGLEEKNIVVVGGDGTVNNVINGIIDFRRTTISVIPTGSGNDFIRGLGCLGDSLEVLDGILERKSVRKIDLGKVSWDGGQQLFAISAGVGLDALVCKQANVSKLKNVLNKIGLGQSIYSVLTVKNFFTMNYIHGHISFNENGLERTEDLEKMIFLAAMNFPWEGGGVPMAPDADPADGKISTCLAAGVSRFKTFLVFPKLLKAKHQNVKGIGLGICNSLKISLDEPAVVHCDGEYVGDLSELTIESLPAQITSVQ